MTRDESGTGKDMRPSRRSLLLGGSVAAVVLGAAGIVAKTLFSTTSVRVESFVTRGSGKSRNILVLTGSGREGGNSDLLAQAFVQGAREAGHRVDVFACGQKPMVSCMHCGGCWSTGAPCVLEDSFNELWPLLERADLLVLCSPLYWYAMSGHIKCAIDRLFPYSHREKPRDMAVREAMLLMVGETPLLRSFAGAASSYRQMIGYKGWKDRGRLFVTGVNSYGAMRNHPALEKAREMGRLA